MEKTKYNDPNPYTAYINAFNYSRYRYMADLVNPMVPFRPVKTYIDYYPLHACLFYI